MAFLTTLSLAQIQQMIAEGYNAAANLPADTGPGSAFGPSFNAAALAIFSAQQQAQYVAAISRLSTIPANADGSPNPDLDSFVNAFNFTRLGSSAASGQVTISTASPVSGSPLIVPVGFIVQTSGGLQFQVIADTTNGAYNAADNGYPIAVSASSVNASVKCLTLGTIGNVQAGQITNFYGGPGAVANPGVSTVTNAAAFTNAINFESDAALKTRFTTGISTGRSGTNSALGAAILGVQPGLTYAIGDRVNADGSAHASYFTVVVAVLGSSTATPSTILSQVTTAIEGSTATSVPQVRAAGESYQVISPTFVSINVSATLTLAAGAVAATVVAAAQAALTTYLQGIGLNPQGASTLISYMKIGALLFGVSGVANVDNLLVNSGTSDITATFSQMFSVGTFTLTTA